MKQFSTVLVEEGIFMTWTSTMVRDLGAVTAAASNERCVRNIE